MLAVWDLGMVPSKLIRPVMANKVNTLVWFSWCIIITVPICTSYQPSRFWFCIPQLKNIACFSPIIYLVRFPTSNNLSPWYPMITSHTISPLSPYFSWWLISIKFTIISHLFGYGSKNKYGSFRGNLTDGTGELRIMRFDPELLRRYIY